MSDYYRPLADKLRPREIAQFWGQEHLQHTPLFQLLRGGGQVHSMLLWGPPGCGKTSIAHLIAQLKNGVAFQISAVTSSVKEVREILQRAKQLRVEGQISILIVDEIHRFNKAQQDLFLPHIENGLITLVGCTTENPSFELNNALLSRVQVYRLKPLEQDALQAILDSAVQSRQLMLDKTMQQQVIDSSHGDARRLLNAIEMLGTKKKVNAQQLRQVLQRHLVTGDNKGDVFYDLISALHKSVRGSAVQASLYWLARILRSGVDPLYVSRRLIRMATEDIGLADPKALQITLQCSDGYRQLGSPEGDLLLAQATIYLAVAPKSNAVYSAFKSSMGAAQQFGSEEVPLHLRNAPTRLMQDFDYGKHYKYPHDCEHSYATGQQYLPYKMPNAQFYKPKLSGLEKKIQQRLEFLYNLEQNHRS